MTDAGEGGTKIAVDVVGQRFERGHIEHATSVGFVRDRLGEKTVQSPEKGRKGLSRAGWCVDECVFPGGDRGPTHGLGRCRLVK
jgi:hypothetical protein